LDLFEGNNKKFQLITKNSLATACRRFISRYLVGWRYDTDYYWDKDLSIYLTRNEFWLNEYFKEEEILYKEIDLLKNEEIKVGQCYELYELLGGDVEDEIKNVCLSKDKENESDDTKKEKKSGKKERKIGKRHMF